MESRSLRAFKLGTGARTHYYIVHVTLYVTSSMAYSEQIETIFGA
jgi:hypothetical protein